MEQVQTVLVWAYAGQPSAPSKRRRTAKLIFYKLSNTCNRTVFWCELQQISKRGLQVRVSAGWISRRGLQQVEARVAAGLRRRSVFKRGSPGASPSQARVGYYKVGLHVSTNSATDFFSFNFFVALSTCSSPLLRTVGSRISHCCNSH